MRETPKRYLQEINKTINDPIKWTVKHPITNPNPLLCRMTIAGIEKLYIKDLTNLYGAQEAGSISWLVIEFVCRINRAQYLKIKDDALRDDQRVVFHTLLAALKVGRPVQYVLGETEFYGLVFKVNSSVLIPRPETEELVDWVLKDIKEFPISRQGLRILDIGTGSGCIPITLKNNLPSMEVWALDVSPDALKVAKENAEINNTDVRFIQDDILNPVSELPTFTIITSNPPYVTIADKEQMHANVLDHEPHLALFVPEDDPLIFYKAIAAFAKLHLVPGGLLYLEINENLGQDTVSLLQHCGFKDIELRKDLRDRDRMIKARLS